MDKPNNLKITGPGFRIVVDEIRALAQREILVGYPAETSERKSDDAEDAGITNAAIGYINENGDPDLNIPARPHMAPAIAKQEQAIAQGFRGVAKAAIDGLPDQVDARMHRIGARARDAIKREITDGLNPPLADSTLKQRARRGSKGAKAELTARAEGEAPSSVHAKPLFDTGELRQSVNYAIRDRTARS